MQLARNRNDILISDEDILFVSNLARQAGHLALRMREGVGMREKSGPHDMVTEADIELSKMIVSQLSKRFPQDLIISEEDPSHTPLELKATKRTWLIDPIDGTDSYIKNTGQYAVQVGLIQNGLPILGWIYAPTSKTLYFGGLEYGAWKQLDENAPQAIARCEALNPRSTVRLMMSTRDRNAHPHLTETPDIEFVKTKSIGLKVAMILENKADIFVHLSGTLKTWDTAGPAAIALAVGMEVSLSSKQNSEFPIGTVVHSDPIIIGKIGSISWTNEVLLNETN